jgi:hypothetical protein
VNYSHSEETIYERQVWVVGLMAESSRDAKLIIVEKRKSETL